MTTDKKTDTAIQDENLFLKKQITQISGRLEDKIAELSAIKEIGNALKDIHNFGQTCQTILDIVIKNTLAQNFSIMLLDEDRNRLFLVAASDPDHKSFVEKTSNIFNKKNLDYSFRHGHGIAGQVLRDKKAILVEDITKSPLFVSEVSTKVSIGSMFSMPLFVRDKTIGILNLSHAQSHIFHPSDIRLFNILADFISLLLFTSLESEKLLYSEQKYRALSENSTDGIAIIQRGLHVFVNKKYEELSGYSAEELGRIHLDSLIDFPYDEESVSAVVYGFDKESQHGQLVRAQMTAKDGSVLEVEINVTGIIHNAWSSALVTMRDLSYRRQLEKKLVQFQKMQAIGTLAGGIAHDFNNILAAIVGYTELAFRATAEGHVNKKYLREVLNSSNRAKELIKQILSFSRQSDQQKKALQMDLIVREAIKLLRATMPATVDIQHEIDRDCFILSDPTQIHQIVMNLSVNAFHSMLDKGGTLKINLQKLDLKKVKNIPGFRPGPYARLTISDTGHGIDPQVIERIFDPFFTTKEPSKGTGMGLSVVHGLVKSLKGYISVKSSPGEGSVFEVYLPRILKGQIEKIEKSEECPTGKECILFVDDEETLTAMAGEILTQLGYKTVVETDSVKALEEFRAHPDKFDLVITDQAMPEWSGDAMCKEMLRIRPDLPIIMCTGFNELIDEKAAKAIGIKEFSMKPFFILDLAKTIRKALDGK